MLLTMDEVSGTIFAIKRFSLHDGPHLRTTVFINGCPLRCDWCHNPEGLSIALRTVSSNERCVGCGECISYCRQQALSMGASGISRDLEKCDNCGECVHRCPALVHEQTGWLATVGEVLAEIEKDMPFYDQSGGGVTFSGGEPLAQPTFLLALLKECEKRSIHRTIDTSAHAPEQIINEVAGYADLIMCDLKHMDPVIHRIYTGVDNQRILENIRFLVDEGIRVRLRLPLIPGVNDSLENIRATIAFIKELKHIDVIDLLPYHQAARAKYRKMGTLYPGEYIPELTNDSLEQAVMLLERHGITPVIGG